MNVISVVVAISMPYVTTCKDPINADAEQAHLGMGRIVKI
jgi:hypothetical protein